MKYKKISAVSEAVAAFSTTIGVLGAFVLSVKKNTYFKIHFRKFNISYWIIVICVAVKQKRVS